MATPVRRLQQPAQGTGAHLHTRVTHASVKAGVDRLPRPTHPMHEHINGEVQPDCVTQACLLTQDGLLAAERVEVKAMKTHAWAAADGCNEADEEEGEDSEAELPLKAITQSDPAAPAIAAGLER